MNKKISPKAITDAIERIDRETTQLIKDRSWYTKFTTEHISQYPEHQSTSLGEQQDGSILDLLRYIF